MPLLQLSKIAMMDVGDAIVCQPASLEESLLQLSGDPIEFAKAKELQKTPDYWLRQRHKQIQKGVKME